MTKLILGTENSNLCFMFKINFNLYYKHAYIKLYIQMLLLSVRCVELTQFWLQGFKNDKKNNEDEPYQGHPETCSSKELKQHWTVSTVRKEII